jgi:tetratricopeptide (TPR) repeat protein
MLDVKCWMLNYLNSFKIQNSKFKICLLAVCFLTASCHNGNVKSTQGLAASDSAARHSGDTVTPKINYYTGILASQPNNADAYWNRGKLEALNQSFAAALNDLTKAVLLDSTKSTYLCSLADADFRTGHTHEARDAFATAIRIDPKNTDALLKLAELYLYVKRYPDALDLVDQAIKVNPYIAKEYFLKGMIFIENHDTTKAISSIQTAVEQDPGYYDAYIQLGLLFANKGNAIALTYYDDATNLEPQNPESYYDKGMFYQFGGDDDDAIQAYQEAVQVDSVYKHAYYNLGVIYNEDKTDYNTSLGYFDKAIKCDTAYFMAYYGRGDCYQMLKQYNKAMADYAHAYRINPQFKAAEQAYQNLKSKNN